MKKKGLQSLMTNKQIENENQEETEFDDRFLFLKLFQYA